MMEMYKAAWSAILFVSLSCFLAPVVGEPNNEPFDHLRTGYPLIGAHEDVKCTQCHIGGNFAGTPTLCSLCHNNIVADGKPANHPFVRDECDECHTTVLWNMVRPEARATNLGTFFDHGNNIGKCSRCHNGNKAEGKPVNHIGTSDNCEACHNIRFWRPVLRVDHSEVKGEGECNVCHNGNLAKGKPVAHINSGNSCKDCHTSMAWKPVIRVNHNSVIGTCSSCHNSQTAQGQPVNHIQTMDECDSCHVSMAWTPVNYTHQSPIFTDHGPNVACAACHQGNAMATWPRIDLKPECGGCHATIFNPISHPKSNKKSDNLVYSVEELQDCRGACHVYTDSKLNKIKKALTGIHNVFNW